MAQSNYPPLEPTRSPRNRMARWGLIGTALVLCVLFLLGFVPRLYKWEYLKNKANHIEIAQVKIMDITPLNKPTELILPSITDAFHITPIWARTNGYLLQYYVDIGDIVDEGQILADIDTPEIDQQYQQTKADVLTAIAKLEIAKITAERWQELYRINSQAVSKQEVDERLAALQSAESELEAFQANAKRLEELKSFEQIFSPFAGTIIERNIDIGTLISSGSTSHPNKLFAIADMHIIRVFVDVPQTFFKLVKDGLDTDITIREFPGRVFKGVVIRNAGALDPIARTLRTEIHINNESNELMAGLYAEVKFLFENESSIFILPTKAMIVRNEGPKVAVLDENNRIAFKSVKIGRNWGKTMEVISGLEKNDRVVTNPSDRLEEGMPAQIMDEKKFNTRA